ncbi:MAG: ankyrin repeat domain-containing protein, partial [Verrucomicrobiales bacterium]|nr:ankyrin repeat domain-containing protein [Verrucomicrobiales bacterium]
MIRILARLGVKPDEPGNSWKELLLGLSQGPFFESLSESSLNTLRTLTNAFGPPIGLSRGEQSRILSAFADQRQWPCVLQLLVEGLAPEKTEQLLEQFLIFFSQDRVPLNLLRSFLRLRPLAPNARLALHRPVLTWAVIAEDDLLLENLLAQKAPLDAADDEGRTALIWAALCQNKKLYQRLIDAGSNIHPRDTTGRNAHDWVTLLSTTAREPQVKITDLLSHRQLLLATTPSSFASRLKDSPQKLGELWLSSADLDREDLIPPLLQATLQQSDSIALLTTAIHDALLADTTHFATTLFRSLDSTLQQTIIENHAHKMDSIFDSAPIPILAWHEAIWKTHLWDPQSAIEWSILWTAGIRLHHASTLKAVAQTENFPRLNLMTLPAGFQSDPFSSIFNDHSTTFPSPFIDALPWISVDDFEVVVGKAGPDFSKTQPLFLPLCLLYSAKLGRLDLVRCLIESYGIDTNSAIKLPLHTSTKKVPQTPIALALQHQHSTVIQYLLKRGAQPTGFDEQGRSPILIAAATGQLSLLQRFVAAGASLEDTNSNGQSALHLAARGDHREVAAWLISRGLSLNAESSAHLLPEHEALDHSH